MDAVANGKKESKRRVCQKVVEEVLKRIEDSDYKKGIYNPNNPYRHGHNPFRNVTKIELKLESDVKMGNESVLEIPPETKILQPTVSTHTENREKSDPVKELMDRFISGDIPTVSYHVVSQCSLGDS